MWRPGSAAPHHVALGFTQLFFGLFPLLGKVAFEGFDPAAVAVWRIGSGTLVLGGIALMCFGRGAIPPARSLLRIQIASLLGIALNQYCFLEGLKRAPITNAGLMVGMIPAFTYGVALIARQERADKRRVIGIAVGMAAIIQLLFHEGSIHLLGDLLLLTNMLAYSVFLVVSKPLMAEHPPIATTAWMFAFAAWTLPLMAWDVDVTPTGVGAEALWALGFVVAFPTILGYLFNLFALTRLTASTAALYTFSQPVLVVLTGVLIRGEPITAANSTAAAGVFAGMWLVLRPGRRRGNGARAVSTPDAPGT